MTDGKVTRNQPFGKPSVRIIDQKLLDCWPTQSELFNDYMHFATLEVDAPPQFHVANLLAIASFELCRRGFKTKNGPILPLWFCLLGEYGTEKTPSIRTALDFLSQTWVQSDVSYNEDKLPIIQASNSTIPGLLVAFSGHYDAQRDTTAALMYAYEIAQLFRGTDPMYVALNDIASGYTHEQEKREYQKQQRRQQSAVPYRVINPRISAILASTPDAAFEVLSASILTGSFIYKNLIVHGVENVVDYVEPYVEGRYQTERDDALDRWQQWLVRLSVDVLNQTVLYSDEIDQHCSDLLYGTVGRERQEMRYVRDQARKVAGTFALLCCEPIVRAEHFLLACEYVKSLLPGFRILEQTLGAGEIVRLANKVKRLLREKGKDGIPRAQLTKSLKTDSSTVDDVVRLLVDTDAIAIGSRPSKKGMPSTIYYDPKSAPKSLLED